MEIEGAGEGKRSLCELPPELLRRISSFLSFGDLFVFRRLVSKSLTLTLRLVDPLEIKIPHHVTDMIKFDPRFPYLVSLKNDILTFRRQDPTDETFSCKMQVSELSDASIRYSLHGWMLMQRLDGSVFFFEPFSQAIIEIPEPPPTDIVYSVCFNLPPTSPHCFVLGLDFCGDNYCIIRRGEYTWTVCPLYGRRVRSNFDAPLIRNNELCYCLERYGRLGMFNVNHDAPKWTYFGKKDSEYEVNLVQASFLVKKNSGELLRVTVLDDEGKKVQLSRFNISRKIWGDQTSLKNQMLFLSDGGSVFEYASDMRGMDNKIYFPMSGGVFYCLRANKYKSFQTNYSSKIPLRVGTLCNNPVWVKPTPLEISSSDVSHLKW